MVPSYRQRRMAMRDNTTVDHSADAEPLRSRLETFREDPSNGELYDQLRGQLRERALYETLAELGELRAAHELDSKRRAAIWSEVGDARLRVEQRARAESALHKALELDPADPSAIALLAEIYVDESRYAETADVLADELEELRQRDEGAGGPDLPPPHLARRAERHRALAQLWDQKLGRIDQALSHWQQAWLLEPERADALEAARAIYASLGDEKMVARLYEAELEVLGDRGPSQRRAEIELEIGRIAVRQGYARDAAKHFETSLRLDRMSTAAREALAEIYSSPHFASDLERRERASELFVELGQASLSDDREEDGIAFLQRALEVAPKSRLVIDALERALTATERWAELDQLYQHCYPLSESSEERTELLSKRAALNEEHLDDGGALKAILVELAAQSPPHSEVSRRLRALYRQDEDWNALASHIESELPAIRHDRQGTSAELLELATIVREHLGDRDRAAELLHQILLEVDPQSEEALARYGDHFRERRDWRGLADLLDFAVQNARDVGAPASELVRQLEEIAQIVELRLGDIDRAIEIWSQIQDLEPDSPKPRESIRRLMSRAKMWESLVGVLEKEAEAANTSEQRAEALRRIAQVYRERQVNPHRAIALYEEVISLCPDDGGVLKALSELYERDGDDTGLANTLRRTLDLHANQMSERGQFSTPREWPVARRAERLTSLRRLVTMYEQLGDLEGVIFSCSGIIEMLPGDRDALDRMERALEQAGDLPRLEQTLEYHASSASGPAERAKVLRRLARIAVLRDDETKAIERWEAVLRSAPNDPDALDSLADLYEHRERYGELAGVLERRLMPHRSRATTQMNIRRSTTAGLPTVPAGADSRVPSRPLARSSSMSDAVKIPDLDTRIEQLKRYAKVVGGKLDDPTRAIRAWRQVIDFAPRDREALDALAQLYEDHGEWGQLAEVLALQAELYRENDRAISAVVALKQARLLEDRLGAPAEAIKALESLISDLDPANLDAHRMLRRLYEAHGEFESAVRIAEREMYLAVAPEEKINMGLEIGLLCRDRLDDPARALQAFERVLALRGDHEEALGAAADLYARVRDWHSLIRMLERRVELSASEFEQRELMSRIAAVYAERLDQHREAFRWYRKAHEHAPDDSTMAELSRAAEAYGLWRELAEVYDDERKRLLGGGDQPVDAAAYVAVCRELAGIAEHRLGDPKWAMNVLLDVICVFPRDTHLLAEADRIAKQNDDKAIWHLLLSCMEASLAGADRAGRIALHQRRARILEERLSDGEGAVEELLNAFSWAPDRSDTRKALYELAERAGSWNDVIAVESALLDRAPTSGARLAALRRKAVLIENKLGDKVRAFRCHLIAFLLSPEREDTNSHLWRLARDIGSVYREADKSPRPEPPPAYVHPSEPGRTTARATPSRPPRARPPVPGGIEIRPSKEHRGEPTMDLSLSDLHGLGSGDRPDDTGDPAEGDPIRDDPTMKLSLSDLQSLRVPTEPPDDSPMLPQLVAPVDPSPEDSIGDFTDDDAEQNRTMQLELEDVELTGDAEGDSADNRGAGAQSSARRRKMAGETTANDDDGFARPDPTIELRTEDLIMSMGQHGPERRRSRPPSPPPFLPGVTRRPPPVPKKPVPPPVPKREVLSAIPRMPMREYSSPWEEYATACEMIAAPDASTRQRWLFRVAQIWETGAGNIGRAFNTLARALDLSDDDTEARARLYRLASEHDAWDRLAELYETAAEEADTAEHAIGLLMDVAEVRVRQKRPRDTEAILRRVLGMRPDHSLARQRLETLYRSEKRAVDLAASLEERTDPRLGTAAPESERADLLRELAEIYRGALNRPHDAIDALLRLRELVPEDIGVLRELADLYGTVGRWSKVIEMLNRVSEIAEGSSDARDALRRIAQIYEKELELPDRAIVAYSQLIALWPDDTEAHAALDKLYVEHARWHELAEILRRRAALTRDPETRALLLRRRADVLLNRLAAAEEAAAALRHARTLNPDAPGLADELVAALIAARREREAAAVLETRIAAQLEAQGSAESDEFYSGAEQGAGVGDTAALMIRLAQLKAEHLGDPVGAKTTLHNALELVPDHPTALAVLAKLVEAEEDPRTYAEARLREAEALSDVDAKVDALMKAGVTLRDRCGDIEAARGAFEEVLRVRPYHSDATWALAGLVEQGGDPDQAAQVLKTRLEDQTLDSAEKARIMTQLAALARQAGVDAAAERYLIEALEAAPNHLPAIIARADLLSELDRFEALAAFLSQALPRASEAPTAILAELHRRLAIAYERLGRDDDAYQTLLSADQLHRGHLLVKLALGENRYRARRWREAALHLSALAMHVDARNHPAEVAEGLYHAALAEIRSLRPEKAKSLYERAIDLKPNFTPALHALAEIAMEEGEHRKAADLLTRQAMATDDPVERMQLFEALGDMALNILRDGERARVCYEAAVNAASPLESRHLPLLDKLLSRQTAAGEHRGAARTAELMAAFGSDAQASAARYTTAAEHYFAIADGERGMQAAERAVEADPHDIMAVTVLSEKLMEKGDHGHAVEVLDRALSAAEDDDDEFVLARKSQLWNRLAQAHKARGDFAGAAVAWEKSVTIASDSDGAMASRRELLQAWKDSPEKREQLLEFRRVLAADTLSLKDVVTYARALCQAKHDDGGRAILELAAVIGHRYDKFDRAFLDRRPVYPMAADEAYQGRLSQGLRTQLILDRDSDQGEEELLARLLRTVWEAASLLWPEPDEALERSGARDVSRVNALESFAAASIFPRVAAALELSATVLYSTEAAGSPDVQVVCVSPPIVVFGPRTQRRPEATESDQRAPLSLTELRFLIGRAAELTRPEHIIAAGLPRADFDNLLASLLRSFGPEELRTAVSGDIHDEDVKRTRDEVLRSALPVKLRGQIEEILAEATPRDLDIRRYLDIMERAADRTGLLLCGDIAAAIAHASYRQESGRHLIQTALRPGYLEARAALGVGVR
ncbi:MAG: hypothetical protein MJE77_15015 [Proteobacteria bacterium]|nr:hypothetical protein [Pseudomonadota bacterium]